MCAKRPEADGPTRGRDEVALGVHRMEDDEDVEYLTADHEVRYVAGWGASPSEREAARAQDKPSEREPYYVTTPTDWWGYRECIEAAATRASEHVQEVLGTERVHWSVGQRDDDDLGAFVNTQTTLRRCGTVVDATPRTVRVSYELDGFEYALDVPVFARHQVLQQRLTATACGVGSGMAPARSIRDTFSTAVGPCTDRSPGCCGRCGGT